MILTNKSKDIRIYISRGNIMLHIAVGYLAVLAAAELLTTILIPEADAKLLGLVQLQHVFLLFYCAYIRSHKVTPFSRPRIGIIKVDHRVTGLLGEQ